MIRTENSCGGKIRYATKEEANKSVANINKHGHKRVVCYKCSVCQGGFHIGHQSKCKMSPEKTKFVIKHVHIPGIHKLDNDI